MKTLLIFFIIGLTSCASKEIKKEDLSAWEGESLKTLDIHPYFSALPREERPVGDSEDRLINFYQRRSIETAPRNCVGTGFGFGAVGIGASECSPREIQEYNCVHQFRIKNELIDNYRILGEDCYTDCEMRPKNKPCKK